MDADLLKGWRLNQRSPDLYLFASILKWFIPQPWLRSWRLGEHEDLTTSSVQSLISNYHFSFFTLFSGLSFQDASHISVSRVAAKTPLIPGCWFRHLAMSCTLHIWPHCIIFLIWKHISFFWNWMFLTDQSGLNSSPNNISTQWYLLQYY